MWGLHSVLRHKLFKLEKYFLYTSLSRGRSQSWASLPRQHSPPGQLCSASQTLASETPVLPFLKDSPRKVGDFKTRDIDCFYFSMPGQNMFFLIFWWKSRGYDDHNNSIRLGKKKKWKKQKPKSAEIWRRDSPAPAIPCCALSWQSSVPGTEPQPEQASPPLWATIFLVSVSPFVFFYSCFHLLLNIPLKWHLLL